MLQTGSHSPNLRAGKRSEYLAQYVFSSFGASIPVPQSEDFGLDLYCVLTQDIGRRSWPTYHYTVQVKSDMNPWKFEGKESVQWFIKHPLPLLFCVVDKKTATLRVYETLARYFLWAHDVIPDNLEVIPEITHEGHMISADRNSERISLGAPILEFSIINIGDEVYHKKAKNILRAWIFRDEININYRRNRIRRLFQPINYKTNEVPSEKAFAITGLFSGKPEDILMQAHIIEPQLDALMHGLQEQGDFEGAFKALLLRRALAGRKPKMMMTALAGDIIKPIHQRMGFPIKEETTILEGGVGTNTTVDYDHDRAISIIEAVLDKLGGWELKKDVIETSDIDLDQLAKTLDEKIGTFQSIVDMAKRQIEKSR